MKQLITVIITVCILFALAAERLTAQEDSKDFLSRTLEDALSAPGWIVKIDGLEGTLTSKAKIRMLTIADDDGVWLTIRNASLNWTRSALLSGRVEVRQLAAQEIILTRKPRRADDLPTPEASGFYLPELPVSVKIDEISAQKAVIGEALFGAAADVSLKGKLALNGKLAQISFAANRIDDQQGSLSLATDYDGTAGTLALQFSLQEEQDGILVNLLDIPQKPSISLRVQSKGPLSDFISDLVLETDGSERLRGQVTLDHVGNTDALNDMNRQRHFLAKLEGDIAPLFAPDYRPFFGSQINLDVAGTQFGDGGLELETFNLHAASVDLQGSGKIGSGGFPDNIILRGRIANPNGQPVVLPIPGRKIKIGTADISVNYDAASGNGWGGNARIINFQRDQFRAGEMVLDADGQVVRLPANGDAQTLRLTADLSAKLDAVAHDDPAIAQALGKTANITSRLIWQQNDAFQLSGLKISGESYTATLDGTITGLSTALTTKGGIAAKIDDLAVMSGVVGKPLSGAADLRLQGQAALLAGTFDVNISGKTNNLDIGDATVKRLLRGDTVLDISADRGAAGISIHQLQMTNAQLNFTADGTLRSKDSHLNLDATVYQAQILLPAITGPLHLKGDVQQDDKTLTIAMKARDNRNSVVNLNGDIPFSGQNIRLKLNGAAPLSVIDPLLAARAARARGQMRFDLAVNGPAKLSSISGRLVTDNAVFIDPGARLILENISATAELENGVAQIQANSTVSGGGSMALSGQVEISSSQRFPGDIDIIVKGLHRKEQNLYDTFANGEISVNGPLLGGGQISGEVRLGVTEIQIQSSGLSATQKPPEITHLNEPDAVRSTRKYAGLTKANQSRNVATSYDLDLRMIAQQEIFVRGRGLDAEFGGEIRLLGTTANVMPSGRFELIRGRFDILGKRMNLTQGEVRLVGTFDPELRIVAQSQAAETTIFVTLQGPASNPEITFQSEPPLPEDEVLARLFFGTEIEQLSAFQIATLAAAIAELSGVSAGTAASLRNRLGVDNLDLETTEGGQTGIRAGKYISKDAYTDVVVGTDGKSKLSINLDVTDNIVARGTVETTGESSLGLFFERDF